MIGMRALNIFGMTRDRCREVFKSSHKAKSLWGDAPSEASVDAAVKTLLDCVYRVPLSSQALECDARAAAGSQLASAFGLEARKSVHLPHKLKQRFLNGLIQSVTNLGQVEEFLNVPLRPLRLSRSVSDGSLKILFALCRQPEAKQDGTELCIESVVIPERGRLTLCVSSQVGCAQGCRFCQTGRMGLVSQLSAAEIVAQVVWANFLWSQSADTKSARNSLWHEQVTNVVFMGMGEPLDNTDAVLTACRIMTDPWGLGIGQRKITISTVGLPEGIQRVLAESPFHLALSLHSPFDEERSRIMPVNLRYPLGEVLELFAKFKRPKDKFLIQYTLIRNVNDSPMHARALARLLSDLPVKVNLIPLNEHKATAFRRPNLENVTQFQSTLKEHGVVTTVRFSKGRDIDAACGQLVQEHQLQTTQPFIQPLRVVESLHPF